MAFRIESYIHSDSVTENKAGALVKVSAQTDFATKTEEFKTFSQKVAKLACGMQTDDVQLLLDSTDLSEDLENLKKNLKEEVNIVEIVTM